MAGRGLCLEPAGNDDMDFEHLDFLGRQLKQPWVATVAAAFLAIGIGAWILPVYRRPSSISISRPAPGRPAGDPRRIVSKLGQLPLSFEENRGQFDSRVKFLSRGAGYGLFLSSGQATIVHKGKAHITGGGDASSPFAALGNSDVVTRSVTQLTWLGANPKAQPHAAGRQAGESNYLIGKDPRKWRRHVQHYDRVQVAGLYPGIDLVYHGVQQQVEIDYVIAPHADPKAIQIGISGPSLVSVDSSGQLSIGNGGDEMLLLPPTAYQEKDGHREMVQARYVLADSHSVGFDLEAYDRSRPLVIDPVLTFAATFGSSSNSSIASDVALDSAGNIYLTGTTCDTDYPTTFGAFQAGGGNNVATECNDAIVTKLNPTASELLYSTYIGGQSGTNFGIRMLVDGAGEATIAGSTDSATFPTTSGAYQTSLKSGTCNYSPNVKNYPCSDAFLLKLSADGSSLVYSTLFGGERAELAKGLAQDSSGNSYISGWSNSTLLPLPVNNPPYSSSYGGAGNCQGGVVPCYDGFIAKISSDGTQLLASTYLGGNDDDFAAAVALDTSGNVYVTGAAHSANFPTTTGAYQTTHAGGAVNNADAYLAKFDSNLHTLLYSTFFGGSADDVSVNLRVDSSGAAYITGSTLSSDLPASTGAYQTTYKGAPAGTTECFNTFDSSILNQPTCGDVFLAKIDPSKTGAAQLVFSTYLGGSANDFAYNLALDSRNDVWLIGDTNSSDFPLTPDAYFSKPSTAGLFLSEIKNDGTQLLFSTFLSQAPTSATLGLGLAIDSLDNVYAAGEGTVSPTPGTYTEGTNLFVMKFSPGTARPGVQLSATSIIFPGLTTPVGASSPPQSVTLANNGTATLHLSISLQPPSGGNVAPFSEYDNCGNTVAAGATCTINAVYQPVNATGSDGGVIRILSDAPNAPHAITLSGSSGTMDSASFVPPTLTFSGQAPGTTSPVQTASINTPASSSTALLPVTTGLPAVTGTNASEFAVDASNCPIATHSCELNVTFSPALSATGTRTASVSVPTEAANSPQMLALIGMVSSGPFVVFSPPPITPTVVGLTFNTSILVKNTGGSTLNVTGVTPSGPNPADFVLSNMNCSGYPAFNLASQGSCHLNLAFTPSAHGTETATFTLADNETPPAASVTLTGYGKDATGPALEILYSPSNPVNGQILFPDTVVNTSTFLTTETVTLLNVGNAGVQVTSANLTGDFAQTNTCQTAIAASSSCAYTITFAPKQTGPRTGTLTIVTNAPGGQNFTVNFAGNGVQIPVATLTPPNINFGLQAIGTTSTAQVATLTNSGNGTLNLSHVTLTSPFTDTTTCGATLAANTSCTFTFKFAPSAAGPASGTLTATTNAAGGLLAIGLNGTGVTGPVPKAQPASLSFGTQPINTRSSSQSVTFSNVGDAAFTIAGVRASENFAETNNCPSSLGAGTSCTIMVSFAPTTDVLTGGNAPTNGNIFVTIGAPGTPYAISAVGIASASTSTALATSQSPSCPGAEVTLTATVTSGSSGTITGTVTFLDGATSIGTGTLSAGQATFRTTALAPGLHFITARYGGDTNFAASTSNAVTQIVVKPSVTVLTSSIDPSVFGQPVTFTGTVTSTCGGTPTGALTFFDGSTQIGSPATLSGGSAAILTSTLAQGNHSITALYGGDLNYASSTSSAVNQTVSTATIVVTSTAPTVVAGQSVPINLAAFASNGSTQKFTLTCAGTPAKSSCAFSPNPVTPVLAGAAIQLTFSTASSKLPPPPSNRSPWPWGTLGFSAALAALLTAGMIQSRHVPKRRLAFGMCLAVVSMAAVLIGCGGNSSSSAYTGTPKGTATFTVTGTSGTTTISTQVSVTVL